MQHPRRGSPNDNRKFCFAPAAERTKPKGCSQNLHGPRRARSTSISRLVKSGGSPGVCERVAATVSIRGPQLRSPRPIIILLLFGVRQRRQRTEVFMLELLRNPLPPLLTARQPAVSTATAVSSPRKSRAHLHDSSNRTSRDKRSQFSLELIDRATN